MLLETRALHPTLAVEVVGLRLWEALEPERRARGRIVLASHIRGSLRQADFAKLAIRHQCFQFT
jgi:hypothetical protein